MIVMNKEELPGWTPEDVLEWLAQYKNEADHYEEILAGAFADVSNKFWWVEDNRYDYEEGTPEYEEACRITDSWRELMESLQQQIFDILEKDGIDIPKSGHKEILAPFMERNGYCDGNGWWIPVSEDTRE